MLFSILSARAGGIKLIDTGVGSGFLGIFWIERG
jgi:hypothetical protein